MSKMIKQVKLLCNWISGTDLCLYWDKLTDGNLLILNNNLTIKLVGDDVSLEHADFIIIVNDNNEYIPTIDNLSKTIFLKMEPIYFTPFWKQIDKHFLIEKIDHFNAYNSVEWHLNKTKQELSNSDYSKNKIKGDKISSILSNKNFDKGHKLRLQFAMYAQNFFEWDAYGTSEIQWNNYLGAPMFKDDALIPYKYSFASENNFLNGYVTEKLFDCILAETLCFYSGAPNVADIINPLAYVQINLNNFQESIKIIKDSIESNLWERRLVYIKNEKKRIINDIGLFSRIHKILSKHLNISS